MNLNDAAWNGNLKRVQELVERGADIEKTSSFGDFTPLVSACTNGQLEVARYHLEKGANRDKASNGGWTPLHHAALRGHLETTKVLMVYGADLNARTNHGKLPIDVARTEEIKQAIRDEPRRRMDEAPGKRATEQDRHPIAAISSSAQQEDDEEQHNKRRADEGKVADEDQDSEPSSDDDDN